MKKLFLLGVCFFSGDLHAAGAGSAGGEVGVASADTVLRRPHHGAVNVYHWYEAFKASPEASGPEAPKVTDLDLLCCRADQEYGGMFAQLTRLQAALRARKEALRAMVTDYVENTAVAEQTPVPGPAAKICRQTRSDRILAKTYGAACDTLSKRNSVNMQCCCANKEFGVLFAQYVRLKGRIDASSIEDRADEENCRQFLELYDQLIPLKTAIIATFAK